MFDDVWCLEGKSLCCDNKFHVLLVQSTCLDSRFQLDFIMFLLIDEPSTSKSTFLIDGKNSPGWWLTKSWKSRSLLIILQHKSSPILYFMIHHIILSYNVVNYPQVSPSSIPNLRLWRVLTSLQWCQGGVLLKPWSGMLAVFWAKFAEISATKMVTYWADMRWFYRDQHFRSTMWILESEKMNIAHYHGDLWWFTVRPIKHFLKRAMVYGIEFTKWSSFSWIRISVVDATSPGA